MSPGDLAMLTMELNQNNHPHDRGITKRKQMPLDREAQKQVLREAIREWMDDAFAEFGKWTFKGILVLAFAGCVYMAMKGQGWSK
jgi:hypothetical protein